jgi:2-phospho-L-lactate guanylyltransferase
LSGVLSEDDRAELNRRLLVHTVSTLKQIPEILDVLVVSRDTEALAIAREHGARTLQEDGAPHLNVALERAALVAQSYHASRLLVLPADLPQLSAEGVQALLAEGQQPPVVVLAPDHRQEGTNALYMNPAGAIAFDFGEGSFERHRQRALAAGVDLRVLEHATLAHDVDVPDDLEFLAAPLNELID